MAKRHRQRVELGRDTQGKPIYKWVEGNNDQEALRKAAVLLYESGCLSATSTTISNDVPEPVYFKPYAQKWKQLYKDGKKKHTTLSQYESLLSKHLYPAFGNMDIRVISIDDVQRFMNENAHYSAKTLREMQLVLGMVLESAREDGVITLNPARSKRISNPSTKASKVREPLTEEEAADIIAHLSDLEQGRDRLFVALLMFTGMRRNEVLGLRWEDIDFEGGMIHVRRGVTFKGNLPIIDTPKTKAGIRAIPMHPQLASHLESRKQSGFVIGDGDAPITQQIVKRMWQRIEKTINVYGKTPHYFRHTFVTFARRAGVEEKTLQTIGGYADISTMRNVYGHTQREDMQIASERMRDMFQAN